MKIQRLPYFSILTLAFLAPALLSGQNILPQVSQDEAVQPAADSVVLEAFPATEIAEALTAAVNLITEAENDHLTEDIIEEYAAQVDTLFSEIDEFLGDSSNVNLEGLPTRTLDQVSARSRTYLDRIDDLQNRLTSEALGLQGSMEELLENRTRWQLTLDAQTEESVESRAERIEGTIELLDSVRSVLQSDLALVLATQDQLAEKKLALDALIQRVKDQRMALGGSLLTIDRPGFFRDLSTLGDSALFKKHTDKFIETVTSDYNVLRSDYKKGVIWSGIFLVLLLVFSLWFKRNYKRLISQEEFKLSKTHLTLIDSPVVSTLFIITLMIRFLLPDLPLTFFTVNLLVMLPALAILMIRLFGRGIQRWIVLLVAIYLVTMVYEMGYYLDIVTRIVQMLISFAGIWLFIRVYTHKEFYEGFSNRNVGRLFRFTMLGFALMHISAVIANLVGAFQLAEFLTILPVQITLLGIGIQMASKVADAIIYLALSSHRLQRINVFREFVEIIHRKTVWLADLFLWIFAVTVVLQLLLVKDVVFDWGRRVLTETKSIWDIEFTIANILIFFFVIWLSIFITRIITHILEKDVFTRVTTSKGMPQTIILLLRIALISSGFFLAASAVGMELRNISIILGAFSVGIGFGLQNIFNNMVSGLILAFERPIKVGDIVQVGELMGTVKSIGLRSSNVRSFDGAEVIVPNGNLISNEMINWTKSDSNRRMDIRVGVAYGTDPEEVLKIMEEAAAEFNEIRKHPGPRSFFLGFGDSSLDFRLLAWVHLDIRLETESKLKVAINKKLKEAGIEIPFPQRDLHIRSDASQGGPKAKPTTSAAKPKPPAKPRPGTGKGPEK